MPRTTRNDENTTAQGPLYMALELGNTKWLIVTGRTPQKMRSKALEAGDLLGLSEEVTAAKGRFKLPKGAPVRSCYEAGRDGFWLHRALRAMGIDNMVVDSASIEVSRRRREVKTDKVDGRKLLALLYRKHEGDEDKALAVVKVPSELDEDMRRLHRERERLMKERTGLINRIRALLVMQGIRVKTVKGLREELPSMRTWDGKRLPRRLTSELVRLARRVELVDEQVSEVESQQREELETARTASMEKARQLSRLKGIGPVSSWLLAVEFFGWREFRNRKQVGCLAGLTDVPRQSDGTRGEPGISKAGNRRVRMLVVELAWMWLRFQPDSTLSQWFHARWAVGKRNRRIGIVALARKLLIALWRFADQGVVPEGAILTT